MPTHTPGPWRWDYVLLRGANDAVVVDVSTNPCGPSVDDARLIAAAPELLAALKDCVATLGGRSANPDAIPASAPRRDRESGRRVEILKSESSAGGI